MTKHPTPLASPAPLTRAQTLLASFGLATLFNLLVLAPLISEDHDAVFHWPGRPATLFLPALLDLTLTWLLLSGILILASKPGRSRLLLWSALTLCLPSLLQKDLARLSPTLVIRPALGHTILLASLAGFLLIAISTRRGTAQAFARAHQIIVALLTPAAILGALLLLDLAWFAWQARALNTPIPLHPASPTPAAKSRIIWIVLDELSHQQVYEQRAPSLQLPAFDRLAAQSTVFTHTIPTANQTEIAVPSLLTGLRVDRVRASADGRRLFLHQPQQTWRPFDQHDSIFQDALNLGFHPALAGWYNPYCRILPQVLDQCFWAYHFPAENAMLPHASLLNNMLQPLLAQTLSPEHLLGKLFHPTLADPLPALHLADYLALAAAARRMLDDPANTFLFLHLPIPHPGGIYSRKTGHFDLHHTSYLDNLALADRFLAETRTSLEARNQWDSSTILIMGDHSWRTSIAWSEQTGWTPEERVASHGGRFDDRPLYVLKLPGQHTASQINAPFQAVQTRAMLNAIMRGRIPTAGDLSAWIEPPKANRQTTPDPIPH